MDAQARGLTVATAKAVAVIGHHLVGEAQGFVMQSGGTILLVDSEETAQCEVAAALASLGYTIATAGDAATAMTKIGADASILVVLVEIALDGATQVADQVACFHPAVRTIFITSYPEMLLLDREVPGGRPLLRKPLDAAQLRAALSGVNR